MLIILADEDLPVLLSDVDMEELVNAKKIHCSYQFGGVAISLARGVPDYLQYEITDKLITLGIDYELRL